MNTDRLFSQIAREQNILLAAGHRRALVRRHLIAAKNRHRTTSWLDRKVLLVAGGCAAAFLATGFWWLHRQQPPLTATAGASSVEIVSGSWLDAPEASSLPVRFSDGTRVEVGPDARVRVLELGQHGAKLVLKSGRAGFDVMHGENRRWEVRAGMFVVRVTGTRFEVSWAPEEDRFELVLDEGRVELTGCGFAEGRTVEAGQTVRASCHDGAVQVARSAEAVASNRLVAQPVSAPASSGSEVTNQARGSMPVPVATTSPTCSTASLPVPVKEPGWRVLAQQGRYAEALAAANRLGFGPECARANAETLLLLGDVARSARDPEKARDAYSLVRQRFAGTSEASMAAFSLGVLEFDHWGAYAKAASWLGAYLEENPRGPLIREARGRLMEALYRSGSDEAPRLATDYLRDYPVGPYADLAQRIVQHHR